MVKVSVIIPVYNAQKYLRQCLDSVLGQSLREIELICVDDSSTDDSREILEEYAQTDDRVMLLFNDKNLNAGLCRNKGLSRATGEYVLFLDADDWIKDESLERLYNTAVRHRADVLRCTALDYDDRDGSISCSLHNGLKRVPFFLYDIPLSFSRQYWLLPKINVAPWGGLCRREFLEENSIRFNNLVCVNDRSFFWESVIKAKCIVFSREQLVFYRTHMSSSLVGRRIKNFDCHFRSYELVYKHTEGLPAKMQRTVLNAELLDIANWLEQGIKTEYKETLLESTASFISSIDTALWSKRFGRSPWYKRISKIYGKNNSCRRYEKRK